MASGAQIQFNTADQPVIQFNSADQAVASDPLGTMTPEEYSQIDPGRQQIRQKIADFKTNHPAAFEALQGLYESLPGGMETSMPGGIGRMAGAAGTAANVASNPKFMKGAGAAVGGALGHATGIPGGGWIGAYAGKEAGESLADWLATRAAPPGIEPKVWGELTPEIREAIQRGAAQRAPVNTVPEAQGIDTSALPVKAPTADQAREAFAVARKANGLPVQEAPAAKPSLDEMLAAAKAKILAQNPELAKYLVLEEEPKPPEPDLEDLLTKSLAKAKAAKGGAVTAP